jgi:hypothetical protein
MHFQHLKEDKNWNSFDRNILKKQNQAKLLYNSLLKKYVDSLCVLGKLKK